MNPSFKRPTLARRRLRFALPALLCSPSQPPAPARPPPPPTCRPRSRPSPMPNASMRRPLPPSNSARHAPNFPPPSTPLTRKRWSPAAQFADQARAEAELAAARSGAAKANAVNAGHQAQHRDARRRDAAQDRRQPNEHHSLTSIPLTDRRRRRRQPCSRVAPRCPKHPAGSEQVRAKLTALQG